MKKCFRIFSAFAFSGLMACSQHHYERRSGTAIKVSGTLPLLMHSSGAIFGNESVKLGEASLIYTVEGGDHERYTINIVDDRPSGVTKDMLASEICVGTGITFVVEARNDGRPETEDVHPGVGTLSAGEIGVPEPCTK